MSTSTENASATAKRQVVENLNLVLADSYALMALTHLAHWNVEGEDFFPLHKAFQEQYENLFEAIDEIAERVRGVLPGFILERPKRAGPEGVGVARRRRLQRLGAGRVVELAELGRRKGGRKLAEHFQVAKRVVGLLGGHVVNLRWKRSAV